MKRAAFCKPVSSLILFAANADFSYPGDPVEGNIPKALALATACVGLWALNLP